VKVATLASPLFFCPLRALLVIRCSSQGYQPSHLDFANVPTHFRTTAASSTPLRALEETGQLFNSTFARCSRLDMLLATMAVSEQCARSNQPKLSAPSSFEMTRQTRAMCIDPCEPRFRKALTTSHDLVCSTSWPILDHLMTWQTRSLRSNVLTEPLKFCSLIPISADFIAMNVTQLFALPSPLSRFYAFMCPPADAPKLALRALRRSPLNRHLITI